MSTGIVCGGLLALCVSCTEYTPKPRGYFRIEPPAPSYQALPVRDLPYTFRLSRWAEVELLRSGIRQGGSITLLSAVEREALLQLFPYHSGYAGQGGGGVSARWCPAIEISGTGSRCKAYSIPEASVYGSLSCWMANPLHRCNLC